jgi:hypothetical protein
MGDEPGVGSADAGGPVGAGDGEPPPPEAEPQATTTMSRNEIAMCIRAFDI